MESQHSFTMDGLDREEIRIRIPVATNAPKLAHGQPFADYWVLPISPDFFSSGCGAGFAKKNGSRIIKIAAYLDVPGSWDQWLGSMGCFTPIYPTYRY